MIAAVVSDPSLIAEGDFTEAGGYRAMQQLLARRPDAVFVASDIMAIGALRALREAGLRVPEDVAVVGFDDLPQAARTEPPLTTVRQPIYRLGAMAVDSLLDLIEHQDSSPRRIVLPTELVVRVIVRLGSKIIKEECLPITNFSPAHRCTVVSQPVKIQS